MSDLLLKRGDLSPCGKLRFWQYQTYVSKKTGRRCERWIPVEQYERTKQAARDTHELYAARREAHLNRRQASASHDVPRHSLVRQGGKVFGVTRGGRSVELTNQREMSSWVFGKKDITLKHIHNIAPHLPK